jgi:nucleotide-binding universal stress UspA family protein
MAVTGLRLRFRSILCAIDFSPHSRHALLYAASVAKRFRGSVTALFVSEPLLFMAAKQAYGGKRQFVEQSRLELSRFIRESLGRSAERVAPIIGVGSPAEEILRAATRRASDLVVVGTQGLSGTRRLFFGSTTEQVLRRATVPVLAIPPLKNRRTALARRLVVDRVIVPIDLADEWQSDAIRGATIARMFRVPLQLIHVLRPIHAPAWIRPAGAPTERQRIEKAAHALEQVTRLLAPAVRPACSVVVGEPAHEIARLTRRGAPLVVMSLRGTGGIVGRRGAIAYHVLTQASTPVLALPRRRLGDGATSPAREARAPRSRQARTATSRVP